MNNNLLIKSESIFGLNYLIKDLDLCNKIDLVQENEIKSIEKEIKTKLNIPTKDIFFISAATGKGTNKLLKSLETEVLNNKSDLA